ncbi:hypothetical protein TSMEX_010196 [Taenia solium]|eukprot:TsM_000242300 transcript=TsM_000242300 gene=TsM_000242300
MSRMLAGAYARSKGKDAEESALRLSDLHCCPLVCLSPSLHPSPFDPYQERAYRSVLSPFFTCDLPYPTDIDPAPLCSTLLRRFFHVWACADLRGHC